MGIIDKINSIKEKIKSAASKVGRDPNEIKIIAVIKNVDLPKIFEALDCGIEVVGENRIQEARSRFSEIKQKYPQVKLHMIGHLQSNKVNQALEIFDVIESVDSFELAEAINKRAIKPVEIFIEVKTSPEETKYGVAPEEVNALIEKISNLENIKVTGLMTIGILSSDLEKVRRCFTMLRQIRDNLLQNGFKNIKRLSMGMSDDFEVAIEEGSDIIRIGRGIFGERQK